MRKTPTSVMVLGIIGIVLSSLTLLGSLFAVAMKFVPMMPKDPLIKALNADPVYSTVTTISLIIGIPLTVFLLVAAIGSLTLRRWARTGMNIYSVIALVQAVFGTCFSFAYVIPKMQEMAAGSPAAAGGMIGGMCGAILGPAYPICVLVFFNRQIAKDAFNGIFPPPPSHFPVGFEGGPPQWPGA